MFITESEVAIILRLPIKQFELTPAGYPGILAGVRARITNERDHYGLEGVA
ncbi:MAG: hypothetical protein AAGF83_03785 [Cyanobacteria bacterium P01_G01_bin.67]